MAVPSSLTLNYDAVLSTTLFNYHRTLEDQISTSNAFLFYVMKKVPGAYEEVDNIGDRMAVPLMYSLTPADSYSGTDTLDVNPVDGITDAFWNWRQMAAPITISGLDEKKNAGSEVRLVNLLEARTQQAVLGIQDLFAKSLMRGNGGTSITTAYTSTANGSVFIDPLPLLVKFDATTSTVVGNINQSTYSWWRNQTLNDASTTFAGFLKNLRNLNNSCSRGPGGQPDIHLTDQNSYELYEGALANLHRNPSYQRADIPFDNLGFRGNPVVWDEFVPDVSTGSATQLNTSGTWWMLNSKYFKMKVHKGTNFTSGPFIIPENQDVKTAHVYWLGGLGIANRRKHGVMGSIDSTIVS